MSVDLKGNRAIQIKSDIISEQDAIAMKSKKAWI